jgi:hypothetical protein
VDPGTAYLRDSALQVFQVLKNNRGESPTDYLNAALYRLALGGNAGLDRADNPLLAVRVDFTGATGRNWDDSTFRWIAGDFGKFTDWSWRGSPANRAFSLGWWISVLPAANLIERMLNLWQRQDWHDAAFCVTRRAISSRIGSENHPLRHSFVAAHRCPAGRWRIIFDAEFLRLSWPEAGGASRWRA